MCRRIGWTVTTMSLSHTSDDRDIEVSTDLYAELTGRGYQNLDPATLLDSTSLQDDTLQQRARWRR
jgi:hypothetical protein